MIAIVGIVVVLGCVVGGFLIEGGALSVLIQPVELLIIGGSAVGTFLIASPLSVVKDVIKHALGVFTAKEYTKRDYLDLLGAMFGLFTEARRGGAVAMDKHINQPQSSSILARFPSVLKNHHVCSFLCDNLKVVLSGNIEHHFMDALMDFDISTRNHHAMVPSQGLTKVADSLPGLGIVAAVLGVVLTMGKLNEPPDVLGKSIGAALLGTFLGILMSYGFVGPIATNMEYQARAKMTMFRVVKAGISAYLMGLAPILAAEAGRRAVPEDVQPTFQELEQAMKSG